MLHVTANWSEPLDSTHHLTSFTFCCTARNAVWIPFYSPHRGCFPSQLLNLNQTTLLIPKGKFVKSFWPWTKSWRVLLLAVHVNTALPNTWNISCTITCGTMREISTQESPRTRIDLRLLLAKGWVGNGAGRAVENHRLPCLYLCKCLSPPQYPRLCCPTGVSGFQTDTTDAQRGSQVRTIVPGSQMW